MYRLAFEAMDENTQKQKQNSGRTKYVYQTCVCTSFFSFTWQQ